MAAGKLILQGDKELIAAMNALTPALEKKVLRTALRAGGKPILAQAKSNAPFKTGQTRRALKLRAMKRSRKNRVGVIVQTKDGDYKGDQFYASFIEYGTSKMAAKPFMRPAFDTKKNESLQIVTREIDAGLQKVASGLWTGPKAKP